MCARGGLNECKSQTCLKWEVYSRKVSFMLTEVRFRTKMSYCVTFWMWRCGMESTIKKEVKCFNYLVSEIDTTYHEAALKLGLSDSAMMILYSICNSGESCLLSDIYKLSGISKQTINSAIRKLEKEEIIYLEVYSGRKKRVCLTDKGKELSKNTVHRLISIENEIYGSWTKEDLEMYLNLTQRYLNSFKEKVKEL